MKLRVSEPWMPADEYGRSLSGMTCNFLVQTVAAALVFQLEVLRATCVYSDPDFGVVRGYGSEWMFHADHTYEGHALGQALRPGVQRGVGIELRVHGCDPDAAERAARRLGFKVLVPSITKGHGLREVYLVDADGYLWVPDIPSVGI